MSLFSGFGLNDLDFIITKIHKLYVDLRDAGKKFENLVVEVLGASLAFERLESAKNDPHSQFNQQKAYLRRSFFLILQHIESMISGLARKLDKYKSLGTRNKKWLDRYKFGRQDLNEVAGRLYRLVGYLNKFLDGLNDVPNKGRMESSIEDQRMKRDQLRTSPRQGQDLEIVWEEEKQELMRKGFSQDEVSEQEEHLFRFLGILISLEDSENWSLTDEEGDDPSSNSFHMAGGWVSDSSECMSEDSDSVLPETISDNIDVLERKAEVNEGASQAYQASKRIIVQPEFAVANCNFRSQIATDLSFAEGDVIEIVMKTDDPDQWWTGRPHGQVGQVRGKHLRIQNSQTQPEHPISPFNAALGKDSQKAKTSMDSFTVKIFYPTLKDGGHSVDTSNDCGWHILDLTIYQPDNVGSDVYSIHRSIRDHTGWAISEQKLYLQARSQNQRNAAKIDISSEEPLDPSMPIMKTKIVSGSRLRCFIGERIWIFIETSPYQNCIAVRIHDLETLHSLKKQAYELLEPKIPVYRMQLEQKRIGGSQELLVDDTCPIRRFGLGEDPTLFLREKSRS